jgi:hypothetical protein
MGLGEKVRAPGANGVEAPSSEWKRDCYETQAASENGAILGLEATKWEWSSADPPPQGKLK